MHGSTLRMIVLNLPRSFLRSTALASFLLGWIVKMRALWTRKAEIPTLVICFCLIWFLVFDAQFFTNIFRGFRERSQKYEQLNIHKSRGKKRSAKLRETEKAEERSMCSICFVCLLLLLFFVCWSILFARWMDGDHPTHAYVQKVFQPRPCTK